MYHSWLAIYTDKATRTNQMQLTKLHTMHDISYSESAIILPTYTTIQITLLVCNNKHTRAAVEKQQIDWLSRVYRPTKHIIGHIGDGTDSVIKNITYLDVKHIWKPTLIRISISTVCYTFQCRCSTDILLQLLNSKNYWSSIFWALLLIFIGFYTDLAADNKSQYTNYNMSVTLLHQW